MPSIRSKVKRVRARGRRDVCSGRHPRGLGAPCASASMDGGTAMLLPVTAQRRTRGPRDGRCTRDGAGLLGTPCASVLMDGGMAMLLPVTAQRRTRGPRDGRCTRDGAGLLGAPCASVLMDGGTAIFPPVPAQHRTREPRDGRCARNAARGGGARSSSAPVQGEAALIEASCSPQFICVFPFHTEIWERAWRSRISRFTRAFAPAQGGGMCPFSRRTPFQNVRLFWRRAGTSSTHFSACGPALFPISAPPPYSPRAPRRHLVTAGRSSL